MSKKLLIVEDNSDMRNTLKDFLSNKGLDVTAVASTEDAIDEVDEKYFDIAVVDINLPGKSGFDLIEYIREQGKEMPVLAMTARDKIEDKLRGFDLGFTDYIVKPFDIKELNARIMVHLKNKTNQSEDIIVQNKFYMNPANLEFKYNNKRINLTNLEFRILQCLLNNYETVVEVDDLIEEAWGESEDMINPPIRIHIANLRKKIDDHNYEIIRTIPGRGYILTSGDN